MVLVMAGEKRPFSSPAASPAFRCAYRSQSAPKEPHRGQGEFPREDHVEIKNTSISQRNRLYIDLAPPKQNALMHWPLA
jgi:hypothetical protein